MDVYAKHRILVLGDVMLDVYRCGKVIGISQESPTPRFVLKEDVANLGAAANVAVSLKHLGQDPLLLGTVGRDEAGENLRFLLEQEKIDRILYTSPVTTVKTRWLDLYRQIFRQDREEIGLASDTRMLMNECIVGLLRDENFDAVIISDYGKGVICEETLRPLRDQAFWISIDPVPQNATLYPPANLITPNGFEYTRMGNGALPQTEYRVVTLGPGGLRLKGETENEDADIPAECPNPVCVVGAGDVVIACMTVALLDGQEPIDAAVWANQQAGIAVGRPFTSYIESFHNTKGLS